MHSALLGRLAEGDHLVPRVAVHKEAFTQIVGNVLEATRPVLLQEEYFRDYVDVTAGLGYKVALAPIDEGRTESFDLKIGYLPCPPSMRVERRVSTSKKVTS